MNPISLEKRNKLRIIIFCALGIFLLLSFFISISCGAITITYTDIYTALTGGGTADTTRIVNVLRLPRTLVTTLTGANLALAGCILQGVLRNPLADPGIIGVSAGARAVCYVPDDFSPRSNEPCTCRRFYRRCFIYWPGIFPCLGKGINPLRMILAGVAIAAFFGGGMTALSVFYSERIQGTVMWMAGGFQGHSWSHVEMILPYSFIGILGTLLCARQLNALQLGEEVAKNLGIRVVRIRTLLIILSALLAASAVSVAGMLGFVGLIVPHIMRLIVGSDHEYLLPCSAISGAVIVTLADTAARTLFTPLEVPVGIFMSFLGAPFFLYLLKRRMRK